MSYFAALTALCVLAAMEKHKQHRQQTSLAIPEHSKGTPHQPTGRSHHMSPSPIEADSPTAKRSKTQRDSRQDRHRGYEFQKRKLQVCTLPCLVSIFSPPGRLGSASSRAGQVLKLALMKLVPIAPCFRSDALAFAKSVAAV